MKQQQNDPDTSGKQTRSTHPATAFAHAHAQSPLDARPAAGTFALRGDLLDCAPDHTLRPLEDGVLIVENGRIVTRLPYAEFTASGYARLPLLDHRGKLILPAFVDLHLHAPQYRNAGLGYDVPLLPWLKRYTFPEEARFADHDYARRIYTEICHELWNCGTLYSVIFGSLHTDSTLLLMDLLRRSGLRAYVGKVNMDRNGAPDLQESCAGSLNETRRWLEACTSQGNARVRPILTPRFAPSCSDELMQGLGQLRREFDLPVQSHLNENPDEIAWVAELYPQSRNYLDIYEHFDLCPEGRTIMAHCIHNTEEEINTLRSRRIYIAHCAKSNVNLSSGIMSAGRYMDNGHLIGIGCDVAGGDTFFIPANLAETVKCSKLLALQDPDARSISAAEAFYLGTRGGGQFFGQSCASFDNDAPMSALVIDDSRLIADGGLQLSERLQKFLYLGEPAQIIARYLDGQELSEPDFSKL